MHAALVHHTGVDAETTSDRGALQDQLSLPDKLDIDEEWCKIAGLSDLDQKEKI